MNAPPITGATAVATPYVKEYDATNIGRRSRGSEAARMLARRIWLVVSLARSDQGCFIHNVAGVDTRATKSSYCTADNEYSGTLSCRADDRTNFEDNEGCQKHKLIRKEGEQSAIDKLE